MDQNSIDKEFFRAAEPNPWKPWLIASVAAIAILAIAFGLMKSLGLLDIPEDDPGIKNLAAALGMIGAVFSAAVTLVGIVVKFSIDDRNARLAAVEAGRNYALSLQAEKRNRIEAAIRAVDLLSENNQDTTENQISGAVLALVSLGELELAVTLLAQLWPAGLVSRGVAQSVTVRALACGSEETQGFVADLLFRNADRLSDKDTYFWPIPNLGWRTDLPTGSRITIIIAAVEWLKSELARDLDLLPNAEAVFYAALTDSNSVVVDLAAASLRPIAQNMAEGNSVHTGETSVSVADIAKGLTRSPSSADTIQARQYEIQIRELFASRVGEPVSADSSHAG